jgi:hypothetical protein
VQADRQDDYLHRILYGVSKCVVDNLPQGVSYDQIKKVTSVSVVYFNLGSGNHPAGIQRQRTGRSQRTTGYSQIG